MGDLRVDLYLFSQADSEFKCVRFWGSTLCDCQSAMPTPASTECHQSHQSLDDEIHKDVKAPSLMGKGVILHWIPGHVNLAGNELVDQQAKLATSEAKTI